jgi:hypothetical protein
LRSKRRIAPSIPLVHDNPRNNKTSIKRKINCRVTKSGTVLVPVLVRNKGHEGFFYLPTCTICNKPILDFESANVVVQGWHPSPDSQPTESLGSVKGTEFFRVPGVAIAVHFECDKQEWKPWVRLSSVFSQDQRQPIEKVGFAVGL